MYVFNVCICNDSVAPAQHTRVHAHTSPRRHTRAPACHRHHIPRPVRRQQKTLENTRNSQYARVLRAFSKSKQKRLYCTKHISQNICKTLNTAKHRNKTLQNSHKTRFVKLRRKTQQNKRKTLKTVTKRPQYSRNTHCAHSVYT